MVNLKRKGKPSGEQDFKKAKKKVGKKNAPTSHFDLSFQSKTISMPSQSITETKSDYTTHRNLTLKDLLTQVKHYNSNVRKDALNGLKELLSEHNHLIQNHASSILEGIVELITDEEKAVRLSLLMLFDLILTSFDEANASTFCSLCVVYISTGMTHLTQSIRIDSLAFLNLWIDRFPRLIARYASEFLPNFITLLTNRTLTATSAGISTTSSNNNNNNNNAKSPASKTTSGKKSTFQTRVEILTSLHKVLEALFGSTETTFSPESARVTSTGSTMTSWDNPNGIPLIHRWKNPLWENPMTSAAAFGATSSDTMMQSNQQQQQQSTRSVSVTATPLSAGHLMKFTAEIHSILIDCWLESSPSAGVMMTNSDAESQHVSCMQLVLSIIRTLLDALHEKIPDHNNHKNHSDPSSNNNKHSHNNDKSDSNHVTKQTLFDLYFQDFRRRFLPYFPFKFSQNNSKTLPLLLSMNISVCAILATFLTAMGENSAVQPPKVKSRNNHNNTTKSTNALFKVANYNETAPHEYDWLEGAIGYLVDAFSGAIVSKDNNNAAKSQMNSSVQSQVLQLLPSAKKFLESPHISVENKEEIVEGFLTMYNASHPHSQTKQECVRFISDVIVQSNSSSYGRFNQWIPSLPKLLWQLQTTNLETTKLVLRTLATIGKRYSEEFNTIEKAFIPFFFTTIAPKQQTTATAAGKKKENSIASSTSGGKMVWGPFVSLPLPLQRSAVELLYYFTCPSIQLLRSVSATTPQLDVSIVTYIIEIVDSRKDSLSQEDYLSFLLTIVALNSANSKEKGVVTITPQQRVQDIIIFVLSCFNSLSTTNPLAVFQSVTALFTTSTADVLSGLLILLSKALSTHDLMKNTTLESEIITTLYGFFSKLTTESKYSSGFKEWFDVCFPLLTKTSSKALFLDHCIQSMQNGVVDGIYILFTLLNTSLETREQLADNHNKQLQEFKMHLESFLQKNRMEKSLQGVATNLVSELKLLLQ